VVVPVCCARTGRVGTFSTTGLAVIPAAIRSVLEFDGVVLGYERQLLQKREIRITPVTDDMAGMGSIHGLNLVRRSIGRQFSMYRSWLTRYSTWSGPYDDHTR